jgi:hypothetical protein
MAETGKAAIFGPHPMLSTTIGPARQPRAVADVERPVVDAGKDVAVQIDQGAKPRSAVAV